MKKREFNWMALFWVCFVIISLWVLAKTFGLINTPVYIEMIPALVGLVSILAIIKELGRKLQKLDHVVLDVSEIKGSVKDLGVRVGHLERDVAVLKSDMIFVRSKVI